MTVMTVLFLLFSIPPHQQPVCHRLSFEASVTCLLPLSFFHSYEPAQPHLFVAHPKPSLPRLYLRRICGPDYTPSSRSHIIVILHLLVPGTGQASIQPFSDDPAFIHLVLTGGHRSSLWWTVSCISYGHCWTCCRV